MNDDIQLPPICIRLLNDKLFEKKKTACREIEIMTKELNMNGQTNRIKRLIEYFIQNFIENAPPNTKIGGLLAISSVTIALDNNAKLYLDDIIKPIFSCTCDFQREVRYRALEALYNVAKCVRGSLLVYLDEVINIIIRLGEDSDQSIRDASMLMDKLVKDIVIESPTFNITSFMELIREKIYALSPNTRKLILSWINFLDSLPDVELLVFIEDILDGLLKIASDHNLDIRRTSEIILEEFFNKLKSNSDHIEFKPLIKILLIHIQTESQLVQNISLKWLDQFIKMSNENDILCSSPHILAVILPCLSYPRNENEDNSNDNFQKKNIELAKSINENLMNFVTKSKLNKITISNTENITSFDDKINDNEDEFKISEILNVLLNELELGSKTSSQTKMAILEWIYQIYENLNIEIDENLEKRLVDILLSTICDSSDNVVLLDLKVLCKIIFKYSSNNIEDKDNDEIKRNYKKLIKPLIELFHKNRDILKERGSLIVCRLCDTIDAQNVYITFSEILLQYDFDKKFICSMVYILNTILLTSKELRSIRNNLKNINPSNHNSYYLFNYLYKTWCHSSVSVISLCFLTKCYKLASELILHFGNININIDILSQIDQLIQMLESPIFTSLRLDLLDPNNNYYLRKSLYGLLMLLPQSEAFHLLRKRLQCIPDFPLENKRRNTEDSQTDMLKDFAQKLEYYIQIQTSMENQIIP